MSLLRLVTRFALRNKTRTFVTCLGVGMTLLAFLVLRTVVSWYSVHTEGTRTDRLIVRHKNSIFFPLFTAEAAKIAQIPGVKDVSWMCWFVGTYIDDKHNFTQVAVDAESYLRLYPEYRPPPEQLKAWLADPAGAIVGDLLAKKYGWSIGDKIAIKGTIYPGDWSFTLRGVYPGEGAQVDRERLLLHWKHLNEKLPGGNHVQRVLVLVDDPSVGKKIDTFFENSSTPTKTESELALLRQWTSWSGGVVKAMSAASIVVLLVLGLALANSMAMSIRDSTREFAVMRAIGWRPRHITVLILGEAIAVGLLGGLIALLAAPSVLRSLSELLVDQLGGPWRLALDSTLALATLAVGLAISLAASAWPALRSDRLTIVEALRRVT